MIIIFLYSIFLSSILATLCHPLFIQSLSIEDKQDLHLLWTVIPSLQYN
jgi:hypothetical protein